MEQPKVIKVSDYSKFPYKRFAENGGFSGSYFREKILVPAIKSLNDNQKVVVDLNGVLSLGSSFLEEAFGGIIRHGYFEYSYLEKILQINFNVKSYVDQAWDYMKDAKFGSNA